MASKKSTRKYTESELMTLLKFIVGLSLAATLVGIVFAVLYSIIFVTQPLNAMSPIDQKFFELIIPIATFLTGTLSGIMLAGQKKEDQEAMMMAQKQATESFKTTMEEVRKPVKQEKVEPTFAVVNTQSGQVVTGFGGKLAPPPAPQPEL